MNRSFLHVLKYVFALSLIACTTLLSIGPSASTNVAEQVDYSTSLALDMVPENSAENSSEEEVHKLRLAESHPVYLPYVVGGRPMVFYDEPGYSFVAYQPWDRRDLTYHFLNGTTDIGGDLEFDAVREAFRLWQISTRSGLTFNEANNPDSADILILWATGEHGDGAPFDGPSGKLAHAFIPPPNGNYAGDIHLDDDEQWTLQIRISSLQPIDLMTVVAHEIGHALGLGHSSVPGSLMYPIYTGSHRYLHEDDIAAVSFLYPDSGSETATPLPITSTPPPTLTPTPTLTPPPTLTPTPTPAAPAPILEYRGSSEGIHNLSVVNWKSFPEEMFESAPDLPPCGLNTNSSRTWVHIYSVTGKRIYGFCAFDSPDDLTKIWFYVDPGEAPPAAVYVILSDRRTGTDYRSNSVEIR